MNNKSSSSNFQKESHNNVAKGFKITKAAFAAKYFKISYFSCRTAIVWDTLNTYKRKWTAHYMAKM